MDRHGARLTAVLVAVGLVVASADVVRAAPLPGFDFDPSQLTARMDGCLAFQMNKDDILMGWVKLSTGERRTWRCSSLRHMLRCDGSGDVAHDPFVNVADFMRCTDRVVS